MTNLSSAHSFSLNSSEEIKCLLLVQLCAELVMRVRNPRSAASDHPAQVVYRSRPSSKQSKRLRFCNASCFQAALRLLSWLGTAFT